MSGESDMSKLSGVDGRLEEDSCEVLPLHTPSFGVTGQKYAYMLLAIMPTDVNL
jgi:hypothetical protein